MTLKRMMIKAAEVFDGVFVSYSRPDVGSHRRLCWEAELYNADHFEDIIAKGKTPEEAMARAMQKAKLL